MTQHSLYTLLRNLEEAKIHFTLARDRADTIRVTLHLVGERTEVEVFEDGHMEVSRFIGSEGIVGDEVLVNGLIKDNRD